MKCSMRAKLFLAHFDSSFPSFPLPLILLIIKMPATRFPEQS